MSAVDVSKRKLPSEIEERIYQRIVFRTSGRIKQLNVASKEGKVVVWGYVATYYLKQLAIQAVREVVGDQPFEVVIDVIDEGEESPLLTAPLVGLRATKPMQASFNPCRGFRRANRP
jgi:hypothetical protein